jgi:hypothetical protein
MRQFAKDYQAQRQSNGGGIGLLGGLLLLFVGLKLAEVGQVAAWSWWWVLAPVWMPFAAIIAVAVLVFLFGLAVRIGIELAERVR